MIHIARAGRVGALTLAVLMTAAACSSGATDTPTPAPTGTPGAATATPGESMAESPSASAAAVTYRCSKGDGQLNGAGSTFINPLLTKMAGDYLTKCGVKVNYQSVGSGAGVKAWQQNTVDFGASDAYLADSEIATAAANGAPIEIPTTFGAVVVAYNLTGLSGALKMTPDIIANIFLGKITAWNDPALAAANPGVTLPSTAISVVHRSDGSGTTSIFTKYLTAVSADWVTTVGGGDKTKSAGKTVAWPVGQGASGNEGVTQGVKGTDGGVGYIDVAYAVENNIPFADVQNSSGNYITASLASIAQAANLPSYPVRPALRPRQHGVRAGLPDRRHDLDHRLPGSVQGPEEPGPGELVGRLPLVGHPRRPGRRRPARVRLTAAQPGDPGRGSHPVDHVGGDTAAALSHSLHQLDAPGMAAIPGASSILDKVTEAAR